MKQLKYLAFFLSFILGAWWLWSDNFNDRPRLAATSVTKISERAISLAMNDYLVVKSPEGALCAVKFTEITNDQGANYVTWYLPSANNENTFANAESGSGHVFEKYWRTRTGRDSYSVISIGGEDKIKCGDMKLSWSASTWVYYQPKHHFAVIEDGSLEKFDSNSSYIEWLNVDD